MDENHEDLTVTLRGLRPREARLLRQALRAMCGPRPPRQGELLLALVSIACWLDGPDPRYPGQSFAQQVRLATPADAWDQFLGTEVIFSISRLEPALQEADGQSSLWESEELGPLDTSDGPLELFTADSLGDTGDGPIA